MATPSASEHAAAHGLKIQEDMLFNHSRRSMAGMAGSLKRPLNNALQLIEGGRVSDDSPWDMAELQADPADNFAGVNILCGSLDVRVPLLLQKELSEHRLSLEFHEQFGRGLVTQKPLSEAGKRMHSDLVGVKGEGA